VIERATILSAGAELDLGWWPMTTGSTGRAGATRTLEEVEREHILAVLELTGWRVSGERGAAGQLGMKTDHARSTNEEARNHTERVRRPNIS